MRAQHKLLSCLMYVLQVVSRAHRMGAVAPVHVEVLAMKHTAEEHMVALRWAWVQGDGLLFLVCTALVH